MGLLGSDTPNVSKLLRRGKVDRLREALRYEEIVVDEHGRDWDVGFPIRVQAAQALSQFGAEAVAADLSAALDDRAPAVRLAAVEAIGRLEMSDAGAIEPLVDCVVSRRPDNAPVAARALVVLTDWKAHGTADLMVDRLLAPESPELDDQHREALERLLAIDGRGAAGRDTLAERLLEELRESRRDRRQAQAEEILRWLGTSALEKVIQALDNGAAAPGLVRAAGLLGDARAVDPVVRTLQSEDPEMREAAADAARALNHTRAVPALLTATQDDEQAVRDAASAALDRMGTAAVIAGLAAVVNARGLLAGQGAELDGVVAEALGEGDAAREPEQEAGVDAAATGSHAAAPAPPATPARSAPPYPPAGGRRRGGFLDRLLGRDY